MEESKSWLELKPSGIKFDLRGTPTHSCVCGSDLFKIFASFEDGEVSFYILDAECADCGSYITLPTPMDVIY